MDLTPCPKCGGELELSLGIWAKDVVVHEGVVIDCAPAMSADYPDAGINTGADERVSCVDCGHEVAASVGAMPERWSYDGSLPRPVATIVGDELRCPNGHSDWFMLEDRTSWRTVRKIVDGSLIVDSDFDVGDDGDNERLSCNVCSVECDLPEDLQTDYDHS